MCSGGVSCGAAAASHGAREREEGRGSQRVSRDGAACVVEEDGDVVGVEEAVRWGGVVEAAFRATATWSRGVEGAVASMRSAIE